MLTVCHIIIEIVIGFDHFICLLYLLFTMVTCFICFKQLLNIKILKSHLELMHSDEDLRVYVCVEDDCNRQFQLFNSFRRHILQKHKLSINSTDSALQSFSASELESDYSTVNPVRDQSQPSVSSDSSPLTISLQPSCAEVVENGFSNFVASLYANQSLPRNVVQTVIHGYGKFMAKPLALAIGKQLEILSSNNIIPQSSLKTVVNAVEPLLTKPLTKLDTEYKRLEYFRNKNTYIQPETIVVGERLERVKRTGVSRILPITCEQHFIPLRKVLKSFFSLQNVLSETIDYMRHLNRANDDVAIENFIQGSFWRNRMYQRQGKIVIPIFVFFDDYEIGNPLGSRAGQHKLGAIYASIPCLSPCRSSALSNIFLLLLFHSSDRVVFGNNVIFNCVIEELNYLSENGIEFDLPDFTGVVHFELGLILGDNLGIHALSGFVESFSANFSCRVCKVPKQVMKTQCLENKELLRTLANYESDLRLGNPSETGIKEKCVWFGVKDFDLFNQIGVDCMHDVLEGVAKYVMQFILLQYLRCFKLFSLTELNNRIHSFEYGPDCRNQPCTLAMDHLVHGNVRMTASEMLTFLRYFGLLVGEFVPRQDETWKLYKKLKIVLDIVLSTAFVKGTEALLQIAVSELNTMYLSLTKDSLKPKFHNLLHYHTALEKYGPIVSLWSMRFEAKHRIFKMASNASCNRRNITLTLAMKHQLQLNNFFLKGILPDTLKTGPVSRVSPPESSNEQFIRSSLQLCQSKSLVPVTWATVSTTRYVKGTILVYTTSPDDLLPVFFKVQNVFLYNSNSLILLGQLLQTLEFDEHFLAFEVKEPETREHVVKFHNFLSHPIPCNINILSSGKKYVTLRCSL